MLPSSPWGAGHGIPCIRALSPEAAWQLALPAPTGPQPRWPVRQLSSKLPFCILIWARRVFGLNSLFRGWNVPCTREQADLAASRQEELGLQRQKRGRADPRPLSEQTDH